MVRKLQLVIERNEQESAYPDNRYSIKVKKVKSELYSSQLWNLWGYKKFDV